MELTTTSTLLNSLSIVNVTMKMFCLDFLITTTFENREAPLIVRFNEIDKTARGSWWSVNPSKFSRRKTDMNVF